MVHHAEAPFSEMCHEAGHLQEVFVKRCERMVG